MNNKRKYIKYTYEDIKSCAEKLGYILITNEYINVKSKITLKDADGYYYLVSSEQLLRGNKFSRFHKSNPYTIQNIYHWCKINKKPFELVSNEYKGCFSKLRWRCLKESCGKIFEASWDNIFHGHGCGVCVGKQVTLSNCLATKNPELASEWHPTKNGDLTPYDVTPGSNKRVWWQCSNNPKHEWKTIINHRNNGKGCPYCKGIYPSEDYNLLVVNPELCEEWDYTKNRKKPYEYTPNSGQKAWWKCKECGYEWQSVVGTRNNGCGCPECADSKGERKIKEWLKNNNIPYDSQYTFDDLVSDLGNFLRFDIAVFTDESKKQLRVLIEFDGAQHFRWIKGLQTRKNFKRTQYYDKLKNEYCKNNNIPLLRIPYWSFDNIEQILDDYFSNIKK